MKRNKIIILLIIAVFFSVCTYSYGKYASNMVKDYYLKSKGFYFTSDNLSVDGTQNVNNVWDGESVYFNVKNNLNQNVITNYDISYDAVCEIEGDAKDHAECNIYLDGTEESTQSGVLSSSEKCVNNTQDGVNTEEYDKTACDLNNYDWMSQISVADLHFDIVKTDNDYSLKNVEVSITVTSTAPYEKILRGTFILNKNSSLDDEVKLEYINYENYDKLVVSNSYATTKCVTINWDSTKTRIKETDFSSYQVDENDYINEISLSIDGKSTLNYTFYPLETASNSDFTITENKCQ